MGRLANWRFVWKRRWYILFLCFVGVVVTNLYIGKTVAIVVSEIQHNFQSMSPIAQRLRPGSNVLTHPSPQTNQTQSINRLKSQKSKQQPRVRSGISAGNDSRNDWQRARVTPHTEPHDCNSWCRRGEHMKPPYNLTAVLLVRIYRHDLAGLSTREMLQWLFYLRYAGVEHAYVYDAYTKDEESQRQALEPLVKSGYVTYVDWSAHTPYNMIGTQVSAYTDCYKNYGKLSKWHLSMDMDEYPFSPKDRNENFLQNIIATYVKKYPSVSQIFFENFLLLGKPLSNLTHPIFISRFRRRTHKPANRLVKPVFKPSGIASLGVHRMNMRSGRSVYADPLDIRMNHYWGARLQNWGDDTPKVLEITEPDFSIEPIVARIEKCSQCFGDDLLYVKRWN